MPVNLTKWKAYDELSSKNMNDKIIEVENYLNEREEANTKANKVIFEDGESFQQKLENNALRGPQGLQGNVDTTEIRQIKSEAEEHLRKAIELLRSVQVNVQGTVLETQFMKKATFDNDNDGVVDRAKTADYANNYITEEFEVGGDADKFYPISIKINNGEDFSTKHLSIYRGFNWKAPDSWNNKSHKGALQLEIDLYIAGWFGMSGWLNAYWKEGYSDVFAGLQTSKTERTLVIWLRGGGAKYKIQRPVFSEFKLTVNLQQFNITYPDLSKYNEEFPVLKSKREEITHLGREGQMNNFPEIVNQLYVRDGKGNKLILGKGFSDSTNLDINYELFKDNTNINRYVFYNGKNQLAEIMAKDFYEGSKKLSEKYVLKSEYDKLVQRVQALETKTQNL